MAQEVIEKICAETRSGEDSDQVLLRAGVIARVLHRLPGAFQKDAVLWVQDFSLTGRIAEELRIEQIDLFENRARLDEIRIAERRRTDSEALQLFVRKLADGLYSIAQIPPKLIEAVRSRKAAAHPDDGDLQTLYRFVCLSVDRHTLDLAFTVLRRCRLSPSRSFPARDRLCSMDKESLCSRFK